jgi:hypothetical protein
MTGRAGGSDGPENVDAAFAEIIAELEREGLGAETDAETTAASTDPGPHAGQRSSWRAAEADWDPDEASDDEHYVPPEPPPLPKLRAGTIVAVLLGIGGLVVLMAPSVVDLAPRVALPVGALAVVGSATALVLRMRRGPPRGGDDDGAQV